VSVRLLTLDLDDGTTIELMRDSAYCYDFAAK
jgi:hypothetical protein